MRGLTIAMIALGGAVVGTLVFSAFPTAARRSAAWEYKCVLPPGALPKEPGSKQAQKQKTLGQKGHDMVFHDNTTPHPSVAVLNSLGERGWELVAIDPNNGHYCFIRSY